MVGGPLVSGEGKLRPWSEFVFFGGGVGVDEGALNLGVLFAPCLPVLRDTARLSQ